MTIPCRLSAGALLCALLIVFATGAHAQAPVRSTSPPVESRAVMVPLDQPYLSRSATGQMPDVRGAAAPGGMPITGMEVPEMADYDAFLSGLFATHGIPGATVAVVKDGRLIYARGFGVADTLTREPVQPDARFRLASLSKPITSLVVMRLVEGGLLGLDDPAFAYLPDLLPPPGQTEDPRLGAITIRDLLQHSGGWDRVATGYDPVFDPIVIAVAMGVPPPAEAEVIIRFMRGRPLDFTPGTRFVYSNFGYSVLGAIIERVTGQSYEEYAQGVLAEAGIADMELGRSLPEWRLPGEVHYYSERGLITTSVFPPHGTVPVPYGGYHLEALDALGAWVSSSVDLMRFMTAVDGRTPRPDILTPASIQTMTARPELPDWATTTYWYALGWLADDTGSWWHGGNLDGTVTYMLRKEDQGLAWVILCNTWPDYTGPFTVDLDWGLWVLSESPSRAWPTHDLFPLFTGADEAPAEAVAFGLSAPSPNPVGAGTTLRLTLAEAQSVRVEVFDALGRTVAVLHDGALAAGEHALRFDAGRLPGGVYVVRASGATAYRTQRVTVVR